MDFLIEQELKGIAQDVKYSTNKQDTDKMLFEKKLNEGLGEEMKDLLEHPEKFQKYVVYAKKTQKRKRRNKLKEILKKIFDL